MSVQLNMITLFLTLDATNESILRAKSCEKLL
jgi:hypothetical protein